MNDLIARSFASAGVPVTKEPSGLFRTDGKRPDGLTLVPWQNGKSVCWDVTVICPLAESYVNGAAIEVGVAAEVSASCKEAKYADIDSRYVVEQRARVTIRRKTEGLQCRQSVSHSLKHVNPMQAVESIAEIHLNNDVVCRKCF